MPPPPGHCTLRLTRACAAAFLSSLSFSFSGWMNVPPSSMDFAPLVRLGLVVVDLCNLLLQCFPVIVTVLGPAKSVPIVTISDNFPVC